MSKPPEKLYKYQTFNSYALRLLCEAEVYYANPKQFNDPLDCDPTITADVDTKTLARLCLEMGVAALGKDHAVTLLNNNRRMSAHYGEQIEPPDVEKYYRHSLKCDINRFLSTEMEKQGVLSLAGNWSCPLMWSHYADEHRGICIEYDLKEHHFCDLRKVSYKAPRSIKASDLVAWKLNGCAEAADRVRSTFFFAKASEWQYENEWRDINKSNGAYNAPSMISAVYFGLRCDSAVITSIVKTLSNASHPVDFYQIRPVTDSFQLDRSFIDGPEVEACGLREPVWWMFRDVPEA